MTAIPRGIRESIDVIIITFMIGGAFGIIKETGMLNLGVKILVKAFKNNKSQHTDYGGDQPGNGGVLNIRAEVGQRKVLTLTGYGPDAHGCNQDEQEHKEHLLLAD